MGRFVKHESCPRCGSRDNLGRYADGSAFCFGCGYSERGSINPLIKEREYGQSESKDDGDGRRPRLPDDASNIIRGAGRDWLGKYKISAEESLRAGWKWSASWEQLLFPFYDRDNKLCCLQARNFNPQRASKAKYYNQGEKSESWTIYKCNRSGEAEEGFGGDGELLQPNRPRSSRSLLVLTEDAVSSLVVARTSDAMPLLGTHIAKEKLMALKPFYDSLVVWLDSDKYREARNIADHAKLIGFNARAEFTTLDPKDLTDKEIKERLWTA